MQSEWNDNPIVYLDKRLFLSSPGLSLTRSFKCFMHEEDLCAIRIYKINFCSDYFVQSVPSKKEMEQNGTHFLFWSHRIFSTVVKRAVSAEYMKMFVSLHEPFMYHNILLGSKSISFIIKLPVRLKVQHASEYMNTSSEVFRHTCIPGCMRGCGLVYVVEGDRGLFWRKPPVSDRLKSHGLKDAELIQRRFVKSPCLDLNILLPCLSFLLPLPL